MLLQKINDKKISQCGKDLMSVLTKHPAEMEKYLY